MTERTEEKTDSPQSEQPVEDSPPSQNEDSPPQKKITASPKKKEKDPKRVAQGKRLAQISKAAKEKKMREKIQGETSVDFSVDYKSLAYVAVPSVIVFAGMYLYFSRKSPPNQRGITIPVDPDLTPKPKKKFVSLFD